MHKTDPQTERCQSCGMPLDPGFYGTNENESENHTFCTLCFQKGAYTEPELNMQGMIEKSISHMTRILQYSEEKAKETAWALIPTLSRWTKQ